MTLLIIGLSLNFILTGVLIYLIRKHFLFYKNRNNQLVKALITLQDEFTQYQVDQKRLYEKETAKKEIRFDNVSRSIKKNEDAIYGVNKRMPEEIKKCIKHIELGK